jgi:hypothetical protein
MLAVYVADYADTKDGSPTTPTPRTEWVRSLSGRAVPGDLPDR